MRIFRKPDRREEGIAPQTIAAMQTKVANRISQSANRLNQKPRGEEIWIMYRINSKQITHNKQLKQESPLLVMSDKSLVNKSRVTLISAWRYPGTTKPGERPPIPEDVLAELESIG